MVSLLFSFRGRINRAQYWFGGVLITFCAVLGLVLAAMLSGASFDGGKGADKAQGLLTFFALLLPVGIFMVWAGLAVQVKRFHDRGRSGYLTLLPFAVILVILFTIAGGAAAGEPAAEVATKAEPFLLLNSLINLAFFVDLGCLGSVEGPNKYGDPPGSARLSSPSPSYPGGRSVQSSSSLVSAQSAMDRAIAEQARQPQLGAKRPNVQPGPRRPAPAGGAPLGPAPSFGRRTAR